MAYGKYKMDKGGKKPNPGDRFTIMPVKPGTPGGKKPGGSVRPTPKPGKPGIPLPPIERMGGGGGPKPRSPKPGKGINPPPSKTKKQKNGRRGSKANDIIRNMIKPDGTRVLRTSGITIPKKKSTR